MADSKKPQPPIVGPELAGQPFKQGPQVVGKIEQLGGNSKPGPVLIDLRAHRLDDAQFAALQKAIIVAGVLSGMLAAGRLPTSKDNISTMENTITKGLEQL